MPQVKQRAVCLLCALMLIFPGCAAGGQPGYSTSAPAEEVPAASGEKSEPEAVTAARDAEAALKEYAAVYHAGYVFSDMYIEGKYLLIGDGSIVQLISFAGYDDAVVLSRASVERVEHTALDGFAEIEIFDKTNRSATLMTTPEEAAAILKLLQ